MNFKNVLTLYLSHVSQRFNCPAHGIDVAEHLLGSYIVQFVANVFGRLRVKEATPTNFQPFNARRGHGLSAEQQPC